MIAVQLTGRALCPASFSTASERKVKMARKRTIDFGNVKLPYVYAPQSIAVEPMALAGKRSIPHAKRKPLTRGEYAGAIVKRTRADDLSAMLERGFYLVRMAKRQTDGLKRKRYLDMLHTLHGDLLQLTASPHIGSIGTERKGLSDAFDAFVRKFNDVRPEKENR